MLNNVVLMGRVASDLELQSGNTGNSFIKFNVAVQRNYKNANGEYDADFIRCVAFGKTAEHIDTYSDKGKLITITGSIQTGSYQKEDGSKVFTTDIQVFNADVFTGNNKEDIQNLNDNKSSIVDEDLPF